MDINIIKTVGTKFVKAVESGVTRATANTSPVITGALERTPIEYVAEVGGGLAGGQTFDNDVMSLYELLKGPKL